MPAGRQGRPETRQFWHSPLCKESHKARIILMYETTTNPVHRERLDSFFDVEHESATIL